MNAEIVSVGTELLLGQIVDSHAATMARILADCGINCTHRQTVGDNPARLLAALRQALGRAEVVVTIGGLGPTLDDITRDTIAEALGDELIPEPAMEEKLRALLATRKIPWSDSIARQAQRPASARFVDNPNGTAPGLICEKGGKRVIALPGPRFEFDPMANGPIKAYLETLEGGQVIHSLTLRICGIGESDVERRIGSLVQGQNPTVAPYAQPAEVHLRITAKAASRDLADRMIEPVRTRIKEILGDHVYGVDKQTLEGATLDLLRQRCETVAVAESVTGGMLGARFTSVAGSSDAFLGGVIAYGLRAKIELLGVDPSVLETEGPVAPETARQMACRVRERIGATYGISLTGNAGPTSDEGGQPVGLVYIGIAGAAGCQVEEVRFRGGREDIRTRAAQFALVLLRRQLLSK